MSAPDLVKREIDAPAWIRRRQAFALAPGTKKRDAYACMRTSQAFALAWPP
jgi:hypothetical protein